MGTERFERGLAARKAVLGDEYVETNLAAADDFNREFQELITEYAWGFAWADETLSFREHSLINLGLLPEEWPNPDSICDVLSLGVVLLFSPMALALDLGFNLLLVIFVGNSRRLIFPGFVVFLAFFIAVEQVARGRLHRIPIPHRTRAEAGLRAHWKVSLTAVVAVTGVFHLYPVGIIDEYQPVLYTAALVAVVVILGGVAIWYPWQRWSSKDEVDVHGLNPIHQ